MNTERKVLLVVGLLPAISIMCIYGDVIISTTHGDVRGQKTSVLGRHVDVYWGIPYATIPARFQRPQRSEPWKEVLDANTPPPSCPDVTYNLPLPLIPGTSTPFNENCLFLNIWVPQGCQATNDNAQKLAVMVWIHGGGFEWGSSTVPTYDGSVLAATQCVIVASINYRLGPLGFLFLGNERAPGNMGLLDQQMALSWLNENVNSFGGSRDLITIFGESAGGFSVGAHMASPLSRDLFSRAILQSGAATSLWGWKTQSESIGYARELASLNGCPVDDYDSMVDCLSDVDATVLGNTVHNMTNTRALPFSPTVDGYFIQEPLQDSYLRGDVNKFSVMVGVTKHDGSFVVPLCMERKVDQSRPQIDRNTFQQILLGGIVPWGAGPFENRTLTTELIEYLYITSFTPSDRISYHEVWEKVISDVMFVCPIYLTTGPVIGKNDVFMYMFNHRSSVTPFPEWMGVVHSSELDLVFGRPLDKEEQFTDQERQLSTVMMTAWANFAKFGNPNGEPESLPVYWPPLDTNTLPYVSFGTPDYVTVKQGLRHRECVFWNEVYPKLLRKTSDTQNIQSHDEL